MDYSARYNEMITPPTQTSSAPPPPPPPEANFSPLKIKTYPMKEAPACVQNAMMTKDKKPFTYTPGGIDLSEIKSPRMARRISRNANCEGYNAKPKSPLAVNNEKVILESSSVNELPTTLLSKQSSANVSPILNMTPPPPPPQPSQSNRNKTDILNLQYSRPEIKIPNNPISMLKSTPKPKKNDEFWIEEYRKEKCMDKNEGITSLAEKPDIRQMQNDDKNYEQTLSYDMNKQPSRTLLSSQPLRSLEISSQSSGQSLPKALPPNEDKNKMNIEHDWRTDNLLSQETPPWMVNKADNEDATKWMYHDQIISTKPRDKTIYFQPVCETTTITRPIETINSIKEVTSPLSFNSTKRNLQASIQHPNKFVDQGYHDYQDSPKTQQYSGTPSNVRIIPIQIEGSSSQSQNVSPVIVERQNYSSNGLPNQSKSFKVLQHITETKPNEEKHSSFGNPYNNNSPNCNDNKISGANRQNMKLYSGSSIPSRTFKMLQSMTTPENVGPGQSDL